MMPMTHVLDHAKRQALLQAGYLLPDVGRVAPV